MVDEDIDEGFKREDIPPSQVSIKWARVIRGDNKVATVDVPEHAARKLL